MRAGADTSMLPWSELTPRQSETKCPANPQKPANCRHCALKSRRTKRAAHRNCDEPSAPHAEIITYRTTHTLEAQATKKRFLSKLSSLHLQTACPTSWWEKPAHGTTGKTKNQNRALRTYRTYQPHALARLERSCTGGKSSQSQNTELPMQEREPWVDDNGTSVADNLRKISRCVGSEKFFSTVVSYEKYNFRLFQCV